MLNNLIYNKKLFLFKTVIIIVFTVIPVFVYAGVKFANREENHIMVSNKIYDLKIDYDKTDINALDEKVKEYIGGQKQEFLSAVKDTDGTGDYKYSFVAEAQNTSYKDIEISNIVIYAYTGGTRYERYDKTYMYNRQSETPECVTDILKDSDALYELSMIAKHELLKYSEQNNITFDDDWLEDGIKPVKENYENFYMDDGGMVIIFPPYQISSLTDGEIKITVPFKLINPLLNEKYRSAEQEVEETQQIIPQKRDLEKYKGKKAVAFTFDDGPNAKTTARLLDGMKAFDAKATFFVLGSRVPYNKEILKRAYAEGNLIGTHTQNHKNLKLLNDGLIEKEVASAVEEVKKVTGEEPVFFRPPFGSTNSHIRNMFLMHTVLWNVDSIDWKLKNRYLIKNEIVKNANDGSIILLHDIYTESVEGALLAMEELDKKGFVFLTVEELANIKGIKPDYDTPYFSIK